MKMMIMMMISKMIDDNDYEDVNNNDDDHEDDNNNIDSNDVDIIRLSHQLSLTFNSFKIVFINSSSILALSGVRSFDELPLPAIDIEKRLTYT